MGVLYGCGVQRFEDGPGAQLVHVAACHHPRCAQEHRQVLRAYRLQWRWHREQAAALARTYAGMRT